MCTTRQIPTGLLSEWTRIMALLPPTTSSSLKAKRQQLRARLRRRCPLDPRCQQLPTRSTTISRLLQTALRTRALPLLSLASSRRSPSKALHGRPSLHRLMSLRNVKDAYNLHPKSPMRKLHLQGSLNDRCPKHTRLLRHSSLMHDPLRLQSDRLPHVASRSTNMIPLLGTTSLQLPCPVLATIFTTSMNT